jgi:CRP/FNR family transcriptional regulator
VTLLFLSKQDFRAICVQYPEVALKVLRVVGARLRKLVGIIEELSFTTVRHRLVALLLRLAKTQGERQGNAVVITLPAHNQELAAQIGTVRELVSRNMSRLQQEGLIEIDGRSVALRDIAGLKRTLEDAG